jgi:hypothetical protein
MTTWEKCLTVERGGSCRDTMERIKPRHRLQNPSGEGEGAGSERIRTFAIRNLGAAPFCFFEAKSLLRKLPGSKAVAGVLAPGAQSLAEKYFAGCRRQSFVGFLAESGIHKTRNGKSFGKYAQTVLKDDVNYRVLRTRKK